MLVPAFEMGSDRNTGAPLYRCFQGQSADKKDPSEKIILAQSISVAHT